MRRSPPQPGRSSTPTATATAGAAPTGTCTAYDDTIQAECGLPAVQQMLTGEPSYVGTIMADKVAGMTALYATMMALFHRERTGEGQEVEVSMFETMASFMLVEHANGAMFEPRLGPAFYPRAGALNRRPYRTKDGHISALIYNQKQWSAFVDTVRPKWNSRAGLFRRSEPALLLLHRNLLGNTGRVLRVGLRHGAVIHGFSAQRTHAFAKVEDMRRHSRLGSVLRSDPVHRHSDRPDVRRP